MGKYLKTKRSALLHIKRWATQFLPRSFHCFCLGAEKTGTTSIDRMFKENFRSGHEVDPRQTIQLMIDYQQGLIDSHTVKQILKKRDHLLNLEMESAHHLVYVSDVLPSIFPSSKYLVTIREPYNYLQSRLNWYRTLNHPAWDNYVKYFLARNHKEYEEEEEILKEYNLYSLDTYLQQYSNHYKFICDFIPEEKRLFIKTQELDQSITNIASFLNIESDLLQISHSNKGNKKISIIEKMDESFVRSKIWENCSDLIQEFFPKTIHLYQ